MKDKHISFEALSDYYDRFCEAGVKVYIDEHLAVCETCRNEYKELKASIGLCAEYGRSIRSVSGFSESVKAKARARASRKRLMRALPALAVSVIFIIGIGMHELRNQTQDINFDFKQADMGNYEAEDQARPQSDNVNTVDIIQKNKGNVLRIGDGYIEGRISRKNFAGLQNELEHKQVEYSTSEYAWEQSQPWNSNIEEVGTGVSSGLNRTMIKPGSEGGYIYFRIYR
jgi:hypothetical protein